MMKGNAAVAKRNAVLWRISQRGKSDVRTQMTVCRGNDPVAAWAQKGVDVAALHALIRHFPATRIK
jgi:hypothetical protein